MRDPNQKLWAGQPTTALARLKPIWRDKNISSAVSIFLYACESWTLLEKKINSGFGNAMLSKDSGSATKTMWPTRKCAILRTGPNEQLLKTVKRRKLKVQEGDGDRGQSRQTIWNNGMGLTLLRRKSWPRTTRMEQAVLSVHLLWCPDHPMDYGKSDMKSWMQYIYFFFGHNMLNETLCGTGCRSADRDAFITTF